MRLRLKRRGQAIVAFICSLVLVLSVFRHHAEDAESLESKTSDLQNQLEGINQELVAISDEISTTEMQVEITNGEIQRTKDSLAEAEANEAQQYEDMKSRIKYMYETGNATLLEMLFSADNLTDFLNKADFIQNIPVNMTTACSRLCRILKEISDRSCTLEAQQDSMKDLRKAWKTARKN